MKQLLAKIFSSEGPLCQSLTGFEQRIGQQEMALQILDAYLQKKIALIEAGTGIGKSLAYLVPAILWAIQHKEKTVISTYTIALQEQLLHKDIPFLLQTLDVSLKAVIVKGASHYLCLRRLDEVEHKDEAFQALEDWSRKTKKGSYSEIPFAVTSTNWEQVNVDLQNCSRKQCPHYKECFFFKARKEAEEAHLLVVNHHILLADKVSKNKREDQEGILPTFSRLIIDEAHHLEAVALEVLSQRLDRLKLVRLLRRLYSEAFPERSRFHLIQKALKEKPASLISRLEIDLPLAVKELLLKVEGAFTALQLFCHRLFSLKESRWRFRNEHFDHPLLKQELAPLFKEVSERLKRLAVSLLAVKEEIKEFLPQHAVELQAALVQFEEWAEGSDLFFAQDESRMRVRWVETTVTGSNLTLVDGQLNVALFLKEAFFDPLATAALCSATLSCAGKFDYLRESLGIIDEKTLSERIYESPFDYASHALLAIPTDLPDPTASSFTEQTAEFVFHAIKASRGGAFVLFTSYEMLRAVYQEVERRSKEEGLEKTFHFLKQGDLSRQLLIERFKQESQSVLFGTDSFWEGVDVPGKALRLVIIVKLPFKVPTDPLMESFSEYLEVSGKNPFMDYQLPQAIIKFKQGFGRLIRTNRDRGVVLCLDKRLLTKTYGKLFLQSLPACKTVFARGDLLLKEIALMTSS